MNENTTTLQVLEKYVCKNGAKTIDCIESPDGDINVSIGLPQHFGLTEKPSETKLVIHAEINTPTESAWEKIKDKLATLDFILFDIHRTNIFDRVIHSDDELEAFVTAVNV